MVAELSLDRGENFGLFVRGSLLYDDLVEDHETDRTADLGIGQGPRGLLRPPARRLRLRALGRRRAPARRARGTPGGELGREHVHPGRHQRRHQPFRRLGAARAGLGTARSLPAAGNPEGRLRPHRQPDGRGHRHLRLEPHPAGAGRHLLLEQRFRAARRRGGLPRLRRVLGPGHGLHGRSAARSSRTSRACRAARRSSPRIRASTAWRCAGTCRTSRRAPSSASTSSTITASCRSSAAAPARRPASRNSLGTLTAAIATAQGLASGLPLDAAVAIAANAGANAAAANGGDLSLETAAGYATIAGNTALGGGSVSAQATALATHEYAQTARYFTEYPEDIQLFGVSFNTQLGTTGIALQGEVSYRQDVPLQFDDVEVLFAALTPFEAAALAAQGIADAARPARRPCRRSRAAASSAPTVPTRWSRAGTSSTCGRAR